MNSRIVDIMDFLFKTCNLGLNVPLSESEQLLQLAAGEQTYARCHLQHLLQVGTADVLFDV